MRVLQTAPDFLQAKALLHEIVSEPTSVTPRQVDKPLVLYGAGDMGKMAKNYFDRLGIPVSLVVDANPTACNSDPFWQGTQILAPDNISTEQKASALTATCVVKVPFSDLQATLLADGWKDVVPFYDIAEAYRDRHPLSNGWFSGQISPVEVEEIERVMALWADNASRAHHLQFVAWHCLRQDWAFADTPITVDDRYFIPPVLAALNKQECFVDVGAHHGEVIARFLSVVNNSYKEICAIEPDSSNFRQLCKRLKTVTGSVRGINIALSDHGAETRFFDGLGYASQFSQLGNECIQAKTLDQLDLQPTFIKFHLEGWELAALIGGINTLKSYRPLIVTTAYHNRLGLSQLAEWLMTHMARYTFLLRLHSWCGTGLVIYAIPKERYPTGGNSHGGQ
jgi:FkbM family methyltransferase